MAALAEQDKLRGMLPHWIEHNAEHAHQFRSWARVAAEVTADIEMAAAQMEAASESLATALEKLGGPLVEHVSHHAHS
jgi:hypothetical protein